MPPPTPIPRFLLPQGSAIWRTRLPPRSSPLSARHASKKAIPKKPALAPSPLVLEKPSKFNPPSHGARRPREAPRYPGPSLSEEDKARQATKKYPNMMPPEGSFMHWFIKSKSIHLYITLTTLFTLAAFVWSTNFKRNSPFADMLPSWSSFFSHPIDSTQMFFEVVKINADYTTEQTKERRKRKVEDVAKRAAYRKAHGFDADESFGGWTAKSDDQLLGPGIPTGNPNEVGEVVNQGVAGSGDDMSQAQEPVVRERRPVKKWLGIW